MNWYLQAKTSLSFVRSVEYLEKEHPVPSMKSSAPAELGGSLFPSFVGFVKAPQGEDAEARAKLEGELQAINDYLSQQVC